MSVTTGGSEPPQRPVDERFEQLGFRPRPATRWLAPRRFARTTLQTTLAEVAGSFTDRRETLAALDARTLPADDLDLSGGGELWIDYVADTGDGFAHTYPVAWTIAQEELTVDGWDDPLPAGRLLVFGGDEVYPIASDVEYRDRLVGVYRAALPWRAPDATRDVIAVPGNHDWYDGLGAFARRFCQQRWLGAWRTHQYRSYAAVRLPHHWWLWGVDIALAGLVDKPQLDYFEAAARRAADLASDDGATPRLVIATAEPTWLDAVPDAGAADRRDDSLDYFETTIARRHGIEVAAVVAGDKHYYARFQPADEGPERVVCGGGGAFLHPTDHVPEKLSVARGSAEGEVRDEPLSRVALDPDRAASRRLRWRALWFGFRNGAFPLVTALAYLAWLVPPPVRVVAVAAMLAGLVMMARRPTLLGGLVCAVPHTAAHVGVMALAVAFADAFAAGGAASVWWRGLALLVAGAVVAPIVIGLYFVVAGTIAGVNNNEAFAAIRVRQHKSFLRLHLDGDGRMRLFAIGIDDPPPRSGWRLEHAGAPDSPWFAPVDGTGPRARLLDGPIELGGS